MDCLKHFAKRSQIGIFVCLSVVLCLFFSTTKYLKRQKVWNNPPEIVWNDGGGYEQLINGHGTAVTGGPYYDLPAGEYRLQWQAELQGRAKIYLLDSNDVPIKPDVFEIHQDIFREEVVFQLTDAVHFFQIQIVPEKDSILRVYSLRLYSPYYNDWSITVCLLITIGCVLFIVHQKNIFDKEQWTAFLILCAVSIASCYMSMRADFTQGWDVPFHAERMINLTCELKDGQFPGRVGGYSYNGYGAVTSIFYPDIFIYPAALLFLAGASIPYIMNLMVVLITFSTAFSVYIAVMRMTRDREESLLASVLYTLSTYRLTDIYYAQMQGELIALIFLPLFLSALADVLTGDERYWARLTFSATAIFFSHLVSTMICGFMAMALIILYVPELIKEKRRIKLLLIAGIMTILICASRLVPLYQMYASGVQTPVTSYKLENQTMMLSELLSSDGRVGIMLWISGLVAMVALLREKDRKRRKWITLLLAGAVFGIFAASAAFPWRVIESFDHGALGISMQFPWRLLIITLLCLSVAGAYGFRHLFSEFKCHSSIIILLFAIVATQNTVKNVESQDVTIHFGHTVNPYFNVQEYQINGTDVENTRFRTPVKTEGIEIIRYEKSGTTVHAEILAEQDGTIMFPMFGFKGYTVLLNGNEVPWRLSGNNQITVNLKTGDEGELIVKYKISPVWIFLDWITFLCSLFLLAWLYLLHKKKRKSPNFLNSEWKRAAGKS